jgi:hypothetical protein
MMDDLKLSRDRLLTPELKEQWLKELRSGTIKQNFGSYCHTNKFGEICYCALGVLKHKVLDRPSETHMRDYISGIEWLTIAEMNDDYKSFSEIADWIEANVTTNS